MKASIIYAGIALAAIVAATLVITTQYFGGSAPSQSLGCAPDSQGSCAHAGYNGVQAYNGSGGAGIYNSTNSSAQHYPNATAGLQYPTTTAIYYSNSQADYNFTLDSQGTYVNAYACDNESVEGNYSSCHLPDSTGIGIFCWAATGYNLSGTPWPISQESYNISRSGSHKFAVVVGMASKPYSASNCSVSYPSPNETYDVGDIEVAGLELNSSGKVIYGGESGGMDNATSIYIFNYSTDPGTQTEAVALLATCGEDACGTIFWPENCTQVFLTPAGNFEGVGLALCNQMEGQQYSVNMSRPGVPVSYTITDVRFKNATWSDNAAPNLQQESWWS